MPPVAFIAAELLAWLDYSMRCDVAERTKRHDDAGINTSIAVFNNLKNSLAMTTEARARGLDCPLVEEKDKVL